MFRMPTLVQVRFCSSIKSLSPDELLDLARNPTSSRILDVYLESSTVPFKAKRQLVASLIGHFHLLVDDRIGSRVADRCWAFADPYLKVRNEIPGFQLSHICII
jgi:nucleolar protein 9